LHELIEFGSRLVFDAATGYVVEKALEPVFEPTWALVKSVLLPNWGPAVDEIRLNLQEAMDKRRGDVARLVASLQQGEADALVTYLARAAAQATTEERMKMLAAAAAGVLTPDLDSEMRSRVARAVEQLEPSDVIALREVQSVAVGTEIRQVAGTPDNRAALLQSGCLLGVPVGLPGVPNSFEMTAVGRAVLQTLELWTPAERAARS
jgi:hypothetical protein